VQFPSRRLLRCSSVAFTGLLFFAVLTISARERWALGLFQAGMFLLATAWAVSLVFRPCRVERSILMLPLGGCALWALLQSIAGSTTCRFETLQTGLFWAANLVVFVIALQTFAHSELRAAFLRALVSFGFAVAVVSVIQLFTSHGKIFWIIPTGYTDLVLGPFVYHNNYAAFIELVLPVVVLEAMRRRRDALLFSAVVSAMCASVIASGSRAGSILAGLEIAAMLALGQRQGLLSGRALLVAIAKIVLLAAGFTAVVGPGYIWQRFQQADPYSVRRELLDSSLAMARDRPWAGFGLGTWPSVYPAYATFDKGWFINHAHNDWAEWAGEGGAPFLLYVLSIAVWAARQSIRFPWGLGVSSVFLHSLVDYPMQKPALAALLFALAGALAGAGKGRGLCETDHDSHPDRSNASNHSSLQLNRNGSGPGEGVSQSTTRSPAMGVLVLG
jgi:O-antigen ligase